MIIPDNVEIGLCHSCRHAATVVNDRGSVFYLCERSKTDPRFPRYPRLPVVECIGYDDRACTRSDRHS